MKSIVEKMTIMDKENIHAKINILKWIEIVETTFSPNTVNDIINHSENRHKKNLLAKCLADDVYM